MQGKEYAPAFFPTKLDWPVLPVDLVSRLRLTAWVDLRCRRPLTLISPSAGYSKTTLINKLDQIDEEFILVLDDYHLIENQVVHDLLNEMRAHPPR